jgi:hypothetical protein
MTPAPINASITIDRTAAMALPKMPPAFLIKLVSPVYLQKRAMLIEAKNSRRPVIGIR